MKYLLIVIGWIFLTLYLIPERAIKIIGVIIIYFLDFKFVKERYGFWHKIHLILPIIFCPYFEFKGLKKYYNFDFETGW